MKLVYLILSVYLAMGVTWIYFLAVMDLKEHFGMLRWWHWLWAGPAVVLFLIVDFLFNTVLGTVMYLELPHWPGELLFTGRCSRLIRDSGWRGAIARFWCSQFLNPFDPSGRHC